MADSGPAARRRDRPSAAFLDRDGTLITETGYLTDPAGWEFVPGAPEAVARLNRAGVPVVLVTNQSAIARGMLTVEGLDAIHAAIAAGLAGAGARLDLILACPYHPDFETERWKQFADWRKPSPGMLIEGARRLDIDLTRAVTIGDSDRDLGAGEACGVRALLVETGKGRSQLELARDRLGREPETYPDLTAAVDAVLGESASTAVDQAK